jgi:hypothetical protein
MFIHTRDKHIVSIHSEREPLDGDLLWHRDRAPERGDSDRRFGPGHPVWVVFYHDIPDFRLMMYISESGEVVFSENLNVPLQLPEALVG